MSGEAAGLSNVEKSADDKWLDDLQTGVRGNSRPARLAPHAWNRSGEEGKGLATSSRDLRIVDSSRRCHVGKGIDDVCDSAECRCCSRCERCEF